MSMMPFGVDNITITIVSQRNTATFVVQHPAPAVHTAPPVHLQTEFDVAVADALALIVVVVVVRRLLLSCLCVRRT